MLFLVFSIGDESYALPAGEVVEVLPLMPLRNVHAAPQGMVGAFHYRGSFIPVLDPCVLRLGRPAAQRMSTRLIVVRLDRGGDDEALAALIAENATDTLRCEPQAFVPFAAAGDRGLVQRVEVDRLVPADLRRALADAMAVPC